MALLVPFFFAYVVLRTPAIAFALLIVSFVISSMMFKRSRRAFENTAVPTTDQQVAYAAMNRADGWRSAANIPLIVLMFAPSRLTQVLGFTIEPPIRMIGLIASALILIAAWIVSGRAFKAFERTLEDEPGPDGVENGKTPKGVPTDGAPPVR